MKVSKQNVHLHPAFSFEEISFNATQTGLIPKGLDLAVLKLDSEVTFSHTVRPLCLSADAEKAHIGKNAVAAGWGVTDDSGDGEKLAHMLRDTQVKILSSEACSQKGGEVMNFNQDENLCTEGAIETWKGVRSGDSGGPLSIYENGRFSVRLLLIIAPYMCSC